MHQHQQQQQQQQQIHLYPSQQLQPHLQQLQPHLQPLQPHLQPLQPHQLQHQQTLRPHCLSSVAFPSPLSSDTPPEHRRQIRLPLPTHPLPRITMPHLPMQDSLTTMSHSPSLSNAIAACIAAAAAAAASSSSSSSDPHVGGRIPDRSAFPVHPEPLEPLGSLQRRKRAASADIQRVAIPGNPPHPNYPGHLGPPCGLITSNPIVTTPAHSSCCSLGLPDANYQQHPPPVTNTTGFQQLCCPANPTLPLLHHPSNMWPSSHTPHTSALPPWIICNRHNFYTTPIPSNHKISQIAAASSSSISSSFGQAQATHVHRSAMTLPALSSLSHPMPALMSTSVFLPSSSSSSSSSSSVIATAPSSALVTPSAPSICVSAGLPPVVSTMVYPHQHLPPMGMPMLASTATTPPSSTTLPSALSASVMSSASISSSFSESNMSLPLSSPPKPLPSMYPRQSYSTAKSTAITSALLPPPSSITCSMQDVLAPVTVSSQPWSAVRAGSKRTRSTIDMGEQVLGVSNGRGRSCSGNAVLGHESSRGSSSRSHYRQEASQISQQQQQHQQKQRRTLTTTTTVASARRLRTQAVQSPRPTSQLTTLLARENEFLPAHPRPFAYSRIEMITRMTSIARQRDYKTETIYMAINFHDRFLARKRVTHRRQGCLLALACIYMAAKLAEETREPSTADLIEGSGFVFSRKDVMKMERKVANELEWNLSIVTPHAVLHEVFNSLGTPDERIVPASSRKAVALAQRRVTSMPPPPPMLAPSSSTSPIDPSLASSHVQSNQRLPTTTTTKTTANSYQTFHLPPHSPSVSTRDAAFRALDYALRRLFTQPYCFSTSPSDIVHAVFLSFVHISQDGNTVVESISTSSSSSSLSLTSSSERIPKHQLPVPMMLFLASTVHDMPMDRISTLLQTRRPLPISSSSSSSSSIDQLVSDMSAMWVSDEVS